MSKIEKTIKVKCSLDEAWEVLSSFDSISDWASNVSHSCFLTEQEAGLETIRRIQTGNNSVTEHVTVSDKPRSIAYEIRGLPPVFKKVTNTWLITPCENGTQLSLEVEILPIRRPATPFAGLGCFIFSRINKGMLSDIKHFLEEIKPLSVLETKISLLSARVNELENNDA